jgi:hypothetical protein
METPAQKPKKAERAPCLSELACVFFRFPPYAFDLLTRSGSVSDNPVYHNPLAVSMLLSHLQNCVQMEAPP